MTNLLHAILAASAGLVVYHHLIYPLLLSAGASILRRRASRSDRFGPAASPAACPALPAMTLIMPCYNEARYIGAKVQNLCGLDYPRDKLSIVIALDGCTDETRALALAAATQHAAGVDLRIVDYVTNRGKIAVLNDQIASCRSGIVGLTDASAEIPRDGLVGAAAHFRSSEVGVVAAAYALSQAGSEGERAYIAYLSGIRREEALFGTPLGVHGALYFFRRDLWRPLPPDTINDDFVLPLQIVERGYRGVYDPAIVAIERETTVGKQDFRRRVRLGAGNLQQSLRLWKLADPRRPLLAWMFLSGKGMRPFIPLLAILALAAAVALTIEGDSSAMLVLGAGLAGVAAGTLAIAQPQRPWPKPVRWIGYLIEGHWASLLGALSYLGGGQIAGWQGRSASRSPAVVVWPQGCPR